MTDEPMTDAAASESDAQSEMQDDAMMDMQAPQPAATDRPVAGQEARPRKLPSGLRTLRGSLGPAYTPRLNLTWRLAQRGVRDEAQAVDVLLDELLAIEAPTETRDMLVAHLTRERRQAGLGAQALGEHSWQGEALLRRLAHLILSLPEAQLN